MPVPIHFTRDISGRLIPYGPEDQEAIWGLCVGTSYRADVVKPRDNKRLKWWWKLCEIIRDNSEIWQTKEQASDMLKIATGHTYRLTIIRPDGTIEEREMPASIALDKMEEEPFKELCNLVVDVSARVLGCQSQQLWDALNEFFAGRSAA